MTTDDKSRGLEDRVGHPGDLLQELLQRIQVDGLTEFAAIQAEWLALMWAIDAYRVAGVPPRGMGKQTLTPGKRLEAVYRMKGNWFATALSLLLQNRTDQPIRPRTQVQGFSQIHQIDLAWPSREEDPLVCVETKVTGAPAAGGNPSRGAMSDFSNRRKELKFAATDLKLYRRDRDTQIDHWGVWRENASPKTYFLWGARLRNQQRSRNDDIAKLVAEAQALVNTYLEGAGLIAWQENSNKSGYEFVPLSPSGQVTGLDDVLHRVATEIRNRVRSSGGVPLPVRPPHRSVNLAELSGDYEIGSTDVQ